MKGENDLARIGIHIHNDLVDQGSKDAFLQTRCSALLHCRANRDDRHSAACHPGCRCIVRSAYDRIGDSAIERLAKQDHSAPPRIAPTRDHCWQSLVGSVQIVPNSRNPHGHSESAPAIALEVCVASASVAPHLHSARCVQFFRRRRHRRKLGRLKSDTPSRRKDVSNLSPRVRCALAFPALVPTTTTGFDERSPTPGTFRTPTQWLVVLDGPGLFLKAVLRS